jgi:4-diphosphocytidyl-2-C-methyl-D-erythritol kinase
VTKSVSIYAPAKVNLALSVGPRNADSGLHDICSWMITVSLFDDLTVTALAQGRLSRYAVLWHDDAPSPSDIDWPIANDLAVRAHLALERHVGRALPVQLTLRKRIPVGGGLGGGSSNAAAMLQACCDLFHLHDEVTPTQLRQLAAALGSDVPFFLRGGSAIVEGAGEVLDHLSAPCGAHLVLVLGSESCSTRDMYSCFDKQPSVGLRPEAVRALANGNGEPFNDLAKAVVTNSPPLGALMDDISRVCQCDVHITGSGSTLFIICTSGVEAQATASTITTSFGRPAIVVEPTTRIQTSETTPS